MNEAFIALFMCTTVHPKRFTIISGVLSSTTTIVQHPFGWCDSSYNGASALTTHQLQVERKESDTAIQWMGIIGKMVECGQGTGVTPLLFYEKCNGFFKWPQRVRASV